MENSSPERNKRQVVQKEEEPIVKVGVDHKEVNSKEAWEKIRGEIDKINSKDLCSKYRQMVLVNDTLLKKHKNGLLEILDKKEASFPVASAELSIKSLPFTDEERNRLSEGNISNDELYAKFCETNAYVKGLMQEIKIFKLNFQAAGMR